MRPGRRHFLRRPGTSPAWTAGIPGAISDRDLWRWALPRSREVNAALALVPFDLSAWDRLARDLDRDKLAAMTTTIGFDRVIEAGRDILEGRVRGRLVVEVA
jgi:hypothetical protein